MMLALGNKHPQATTVTLLLVAERQRETPGLEEAAYVVLDRYFADWPDEKKADLYALMAERVKGDMPLGKMEAAVSRCLWDNENGWAAR